LQDRDGRQLRRIVRAGNVLALGLAADGKTSATWSNPVNAGPCLYDLWDLATGKALFTRADTSPVAAAPHFSPDGQIVAEYIYEKRPERPAPWFVGVLLREVATGREIRRLRQPDDGFGPFAPDGRALVSVTGQLERVGEGRFRADDTLHVWELATGKERLTLSFGTSSLSIGHVAYAPDGRTLATARSDPSGHMLETVRNDHTIQFWDLMTGKELPHRMALEAPVSCLAFSPDSRLLASGHRDGTILVWDAAFAGRREGHQGAKPDAGQLVGWWVDLAGDDARKAYAAIHRLSASPGQAIGLFRDRLRPVAEGPAKKLRLLLADLDSPEFQRRRDAAKQLTALGERAGPALRAALKAGPSLEQRRQIVQILEALQAVPSGEALRHLRAVEVLELIGTDEVREMLGTLARGIPEARLTREAKASLQRLARRPIPKP
jgi:hypothetical protein